MDWVTRGSVESRTGVNVNLPGLRPFHLEHGRKVRIEKADMPFLPPEFSESSLSLKLGARRVFRDESRRDSLQLREYDGHWTLELDHFNPEKGPVEFAGHAFADALAVTMAVCGVAVAAFALRRFA